MGTRADFYVGRDPVTMEWLGSIAWDGHPDNDEYDPIFEAETEEDYRTAVAGLAAKRDDWTAPADGWPWPWKDSHLTDCSYTFEEGGVLCSDGRGWIPALEVRQGILDAIKSEGCFSLADIFEGAIDAAWPDMSDRQKVTSGPRSGLIVLGGREKDPE